MTNVYCKVMLTRAYEAAARTLRSNLHPSYTRVLHRVNCRLWLGRRRARAHVRRYRVVKYHIHSGLRDIVCDKSSRVDSWSPFEPSHA